MLTDKMDIFTCQPHNDLLSDREDNEAYCIANPGKEYAVYFTNGGQVMLDISPLKKPAEVRWLDIMKSKWTTNQQTESESKIKLSCLSKGYWAALITNK
jgi:hypothetical protein